MKPQINRFFERIINMIIDRERVKNTFAEYTSGYNATDPKIKLKIDHTYRVAELCELISRDLKLDEYETDVAWLTGMLHDAEDLNRLSAITHLTMHSLLIMPILEPTCCLRKGLSTHMWMDFMMINTA